MAQKGIKSGMAGIATRIESSAVAAAGSDRSGGKRGATSASPALLSPALEAERQRRQRMRSIAIAVALAAMVGLFYAATIVRLGGNVLNRSL